MEDIVQFCDEEGLVLMADEVYQENIVVGREKFTSSKVVATWHPMSSCFLPLFKKGSGGGGRRRGYVELTNIDEGVKEEIARLDLLKCCRSAHGWTDGESS